MDVKKLRAAATDLVKGFQTHGGALPLLPEDLIRKVPTEGEILKVLEFPGRDQGLKPSIQVRVHRL